MVGGVPEAQDGERSAGTERCAGPGGRRDKAKPASAPLTLLPRWEWKGQKMETDSYLYASYRIWGLSLMMIDEMMGLLRR